MLKKNAYQAAIVQVKEKVNLLTRERNIINEGILEDTKSSAGDKFETGREMMSRDLMNVENQLKQAKFELDELYRLQAIKEPSEAIQEGSMVLLGTDKFLLSVGLGQLNVDGEMLFLLSKNSPLGQSLVGKRLNDQVVFRGSPTTIKEIS